MKPIIVKRSDCRRDTFRAGGKGGQHQNVTDSAVRYTHLPTGIQAESRTERSQHQNDQNAWGLLLAKITRMQEDKAAFDAMQAWKAKPDAAHGHQDRSYFIGGREARVVDHRTGVKGNPANVLRGKIDGFLRAANGGQP